jgi:hypothetical protein
MGLFTRFTVWRLKRQYQEKADLFHRGQVFRAELASANPTTPEAVKAAYIRACEAVPVVMTPVPPLPGEQGFLRLVKGDPQSGK